MISGYWFTIDPYVYIGVEKNRVLLYNTLDYSHIESNDIEIISLFNKLIDRDSYGVCFLSCEDYNRPNIKEFVMNLRDKYMGDIIDINFSNGKPIQIAPYYNISIRDKSIYEKNNFSQNSDIEKTLCELDIYLEKGLDVSKVINFLNTCSHYLRINLIGDTKKNFAFDSLLDYLESTSYNIVNILNYKEINLNYFDHNKFTSYVIEVDYPVFNDRIENVIKILNLKKVDLDICLVFKVKSDYEYDISLDFVQKYFIDKYLIKPIYTGDNIVFFENNVFLNETDILSQNLSMRDIFTHHAINSLYFGKLSIASDGSVYSNMLSPSLGNISSHNIVEIICEEIKNKYSWFNVRNRKPCNNCVFQWLCPPPSDYEIQIGKSNLCHVK